MFQYLIRVGYVYSAAQLCDTIFRFHSFHQTTHISREHFAHDCLFCVCYYFVCDPAFSTSWDVHPESKMKPSLSVCTCCAQWIKHIAHFPLRKLVRLTNLCCAPRVQNALWSPAHRACVCTILLLVSGISIFKLSACPSTRCGGGGGGGGGDCGGSVRSDTCRRVFALYSAQFHYSAESALARLQCACGLYGFVSAYVCTCLWESPHLKRII